jgi:hypothetical protein
LDGKNGLDLIVVSDFAGADLYLNDGMGKFKLATENLGDSLGFGMAHTFSDFNVDGKTRSVNDRNDLPHGRSIGTSQTVEIWSDRGSFFEATSGTWEPPFLSKSTLAMFEQNELSQSITRAGWAWGCSSADFRQQWLPGCHHWQWS